MVCELCNITTLHITFISNLFCKYGKNLLPLQTKNNNNLNIQPYKSYRYDYQAFTGGGLPTSASSVNAMCGACRPSHHRFSDSGM